MATTALAFAAPAHAANVNVTATCFEGGVVVDTYDVVAFPGDTISVVNLTGDSLDAMNRTGFTTSGTIPIPDLTQATFTVSATTGGFELVSAAVDCDGFTAEVAFGPASSSSAPPSVTQQFGRPSTGTCNAAAPASLNWAGVASGGWGESYAEWMNNGTGGFVCTRTLVYSDNLGAWTVS